MNYVLSIINNGSITAENILLTDAFSQTLPAYLTYVSDNSGVTPSHPSSSVYQWSLGSLAPGAEKSFILQAQLGSSFPDGDTRVSNYAKVTTTSPEKDFTNNEISDIDLVTAHPDLSIAKTFTSGIPAGTGSTIVYRISGGNIGHAVATSVTLTDTLDSIATYINGSASLTVNSSPASLGVAYNAGTKKLTFSLPDLAVGDTFVLSYQAVIGSVTGSPVINSAEITLSQTDPNLDNNNANVAVPTSQNIDVYVDKSAAADPGQAAPAGQIVYTLAYGNNGIDASTTTTLQDSIPANTNLIIGSITGGGSESGGVITWNLGPLASRASGSVSYAVTINTPLPAGVTAIDNSATIASNPVDGYAPNNTSSTSTPVTAQPDLVITKTDGMTEIMAGNTVPYTITYRNVGNQAATGVTIVDTLQSGLEIDPSKLSGVTYTGSNPASTYNALAGTLTWTIGALGVDGAHTITVDLKVKANVRPGSVVANHAALTDDLSNGADINPGNNLVTHSDLAAAPLIALEKRASGPVYDGQKVTYSILWTNTGSSAAADVTIQDTLPGNTGAPTDITGGGIYNAGQGKLTWNLGSQPAGASGSVSYAIVPNVGAGGASQAAPSLTAESAGGSLVVTSTVLARPAGRGVKMTSAPTSKEYTRIQMATRQRVGTITPS